MGWLANSPVVDGARGRRKWTTARFGVDASAANRGASSRFTKLRPAVKRTTDVCLAVVLLATTLLPLLVIALAIKLNSRGPVFYRVRRVGYGGRPLMMLKFRKMHHGATGMPLTANADPRLTRVGRILARTKFDELPQFWDVLRGRMSIVGPRPEDPGFVALHAEAYDHILSVRPGITGLSQIAFAEEQKILDQRDLVADYVDRILPQKIALDTMYTDACGMRLDLAVIRWTVVAILFGRPVAVHRSNGRMNLRKRLHVADGGISEVEAAAEAVADAAIRISSPLERGCVGVVSTVEHPEMLTEVA